MGPEGESQLWVAADLGDTDRSEAKLTHTIFELMPEPECAAQGDRRLSATHILYLKRVFVAYVIIAAQDMVLGLVCCQG